MPLLPIASANTSASTRTNFALRYGRSLHKADRAFAQWVKDHGFDDMHRQDRADAMWLAENWAEVSHGVSPDLSHPRRIREEHRAVQADTPPSPELAFSAPSKLTASIEQVAPVASKINKLNATGVAGLHGRARGRTGAKDSPEAPLPELIKSPFKALSTGHTGHLAPSLLSQPAPH